MDPGALSELISSRAGGLPVQVDDLAPEHPHVPGHAAAVSFPAAPDAPIRVHEGALAALAAAEPDFDAEALVERILAVAGARRAEDEQAAEAMPRDKALFEAHARFLTDRDVPAGWYRRGESLGTGLWAVDLDVFLEIVLREREWEALRGRPVALEVEGERFEIELPDDAEPDECWTLPGCGLFETEASLKLDELEPDDEVPGRFGDLHILPVSI